MYPSSGSSRSESSDHREDDVVVELAFDDDREWLVMGLVELSLCAKESDEGIEELGMDEV